MCVCLHMHVDFFNVCLIEAASVLKDTIAAGY